MRSGRREKGINNEKKEKRCRFKTILEFELREDGGASGTGSNKSDEKRGKHRDGSKSRSVVWQGRRERIVYQLKIMAKNSKDGRPHSTVTGENMGERQNSKRKEDLAQTTTTNSIYRFVLGGEN